MNKRVYVVSHIALLYIAEERKYKNASADFLVLRKSLPQN
jgi:hypothetical protein